MNDNGRLELAFEIMRAVAQPNAEFKVGDRVEMYYVSYGGNSETWLEARRPESDAPRREVALVTAVDGRDLDVMIAGIVGPDDRRFVTTVSNPPRLYVEIGDAR